LPELTYGEDWKESYDRQCEVLDRLEAASAANDEVKGTVLDFPVADGSAHYLVTSAKPLTLQHIPFADGYRIPVAHIRGITAADVLQQKRRSRALRELFAKKA